jgi:hypothetical protein
MRAAVVQRSVQSSELSRNSAAVFAAAEKGPVNITRRDGADFVLTTASAVAEEHRALRVASDLVAASLAPSEQSLEERLRRQFPWIEFLPANDRTTFATEIVDVTRACAAVGQFSRLLITFEAWHSTAEAIAAGYTPDDQLDWLDEPAPVADPRQQV